MTRDCNLLAITSFKLVSLSKSVKRIVLINVSYINTNFMSNKIFSRLFGRTNHHGKLMFYLDFLCTLVLMQKPSKYPFFNKCSELKAFSVWLQGDTVSFRDIYVGSKMIFLSRLWPLLKWALVFEAAGAVSKIGLSLKSNHHWQI